MESSKNGGTGNDAEKILATFTDEQRRIFTNLSLLTRSNSNTPSSSLSSSSKNQSQNIVKPPGSLDESTISSDDDCIIIDNSDDERKEVMIEDVSSEISNGSIIKDENGTITVTAPKVESEDESESEQEWDVITIDDDDDDKPKIPPARMICYRCPNKKQGTFTDPKKYFVHLKRHILNDHFACLTCKRPFLKLNYCLSHELRVHGSTLECEFKDPVISFAKNYVSNRKGKVSRAARSTREIETDDENTDCEDTKFYENRFTKNSGMYPYKGPVVTSILEAYEIQTYQPRKKANRINGVARIAINVHKQNVQKEQYTFKLGKFSGKKSQRGKIADPQTENAKAKKPITKKAPKQAAVKRARESASECEIYAKEQPKKKRVRYAYITSSSSSSESDSDNTGDVDYLPSKKKRYDESINSNSKQQPSKVKYKKALPPILDRKCVQCKNFEWEHPDDLRSHRDAVHPNLHLVDLMAVTYSVPVRKAVLKTTDVEKVVEKKEVNRNGTIRNDEKVVPAPSKKVVKKVAETTKKTAKASGSGKRVARKTAKVPKKGEKGLRDDSAKKTRIQSKRGLKGNGPKSQFPLPDSTFSQKELFLHALGLSNCIRLHLHQKKPVEDLKLRQCSVMVQKLSDLEVEFYRNRGSNSSLHNMLRGHFLAS